MQDTTISERNLLGAALLDGSTWELAAAALPSENFSNDSHCYIHRAMAAIAKRGDHISLITVADELGRRKQLDRIGGSAYLSTLAEGAITAAKHLRYCSEQIQRAAGVRHIRDTANTILNAAEAGAELGELRARL